MKNMYRDFLSTYIYQGPGCLLGEFADRGSDDEKVTGALLRTFNNRAIGFNMVLAVNEASRKWLRKSNLFLEKVHDKGYDDAFHVYRNLGFTYQQTLVETPSQTIEEAALFASPFADSNFGHELSSVFHFIHHYRKRQLTCPIVLLERSKRIPRILELLDLLTIKLPTIFLPDDTVVRVKTLHLFSTIEEQAYFNIHRYQSIIEEVCMNASAHQRDNHYPPNVFLVKTHEHTRVMSPWTVIHCAELLKKMRNDPEWSVISPEHDELSMPQIIAILRRARRIVTSAGCISYAHEPFFGKRSQLYYLQTEHGPYETFRHRYRIIECPLTLDAAETARIWKELTGT